MLDKTSYHSRKGKSCDLEKKERRGSLSICHLYTELSTGTGKKVFCGITAMIHLLQK